VSTVLDAACGIGYGSNMLAKAGYKVVGADISEEAIEYAKEHWSHDNIKFINVDLTHANLPKVDAVISFETIEHTDQYHDILERFRCASDLLICSVPNEAVVPFSKETHPFHVRHFTRDEFDEALFNAHWRSDYYYGQKDKRPGEVKGWATGARCHIVIARAIG
jgi:SAM-dependent methyltransferase